MIHSQHASFTAAAALWTAAALAVGLGAAANPGAALAQAAAAVPADQAGAGDQAASSQNHLVVPLSHPSQPATLKVSLLDGSITVHAYDGKEVVIDTSSGSGRRRRERPAPPEAQGMRRLTPSAGVSAEEDNNIVTVRASIFNGGDSNLVIQVPVHTSLSLHTVNGGNITVSGTDGDISVDNTNGNVTLDHVAGSIVAHALNGRVTAAIARLDPSKPSSFSSLNGRLDITLPADARANLLLKTDNGDIYMDDGFNFVMTHPSAAPKPGERGSDGMYKVKIDRSVYGTLNGGGPELRVENFNGNIYLRRAK